MEDKKEKKDLGFPTFQYSRFSGLNKDGQYVVRGNDWNEFYGYVKIVDDLIKAEKDMEESINESAKKTAGLGFPDDTPEEHLCQVHHVAMQKKHGKYGEFWSHMSPTGWCTGVAK